MDTQVKGVNTSIYQLAKQSADSFNQGKGKAKEMSVSLEELNKRADQNLLSVLEYRKLIKLLGQEMAEAGQRGDTEMYGKLAARIGELKNDAGDLAQQMKYLDPGEFLAGTVKLTQGIAGGFSAISAGFSLIAGDNEEMQKMMGKTAKVIQLLQGLEQLRQLTEKKGLVAGLAGQVRRILGHLGVTTAITTETVATGAATTAQWGWNAAMLANPIFLIITGVAALTAGLIVLANKYDNVAEANRQWLLSSRKTLGELNTHNENMKGLLDDLYNKMRDIREADLNEGEKKKNRWKEEFDRGNKVITQTMAEIAVKKQLLEIEIEKNKLSANFYRVQGPAGLYMASKLDKEIKMQQDSLNNFNNILTGGKKKLQDLALTQQKLLTGVTTIFNTDPGDKDNGVKKEETGLEESVRAPQNIYINITKLIESFSVSTTTISESKDEIRSLVSEALLEAINDVNVIPVK
jgi:hypothetical protein